MTIGKRTVIILALLAILSSILILSAWIWRFGTSARPARSDCIIVLGCRVYDTIPSPFLRARLDEAIRLYREGYAPWIIVSGAKGPGEDISEAAAMKQYLVQNGVDGSRVIEEDKSTSTETNLRFSLGKMKEHGFATAVIVSNQYHLARAALIAGRIGLDASYSGTILPEYRRTEIIGLIREVPALIYSFLTVR